MRKRTDRIRKSLFWIVLVVSIALIALSFLPRLFGYVVCGIEDDSMLPLLHRGDLVFAKPIGFARIQTGDVLVFEDPKTGGRFTRTVTEVWTDKQELVTRSAQNALPDPYTTAYRCVIGRAEKTIRFVGYPSVWLHTVLGKIILALLYIIWLAVEIEAYAAGKRREKTDA